MMRYIALLFVFFFLSFAPAQRPPGGLKLALLKYNGGGDWYAVVDALQNFAKFCNDNLGTNFDTEYATVDVGSPDIFNHPFLFMTGHGNIVLSDADAENLRTYLMGGGFLFVDDDYGMEPYFKVAAKKLFPDRELVELPFEHPIYRQKYEFKKGLPKIHEHDGKPPRGYGIFHEGRLVLFFGVESNISDGWESREVHRTPEELRQQSLRMGANIVQFAFKQ
ncbi:MAG: DUF4159 domain-containing protein [Saprospiraceae bacterium]|nr:DUF4159 domain-containing protein [Saprospiraceae bacterium]HRD81419.1 DUF4159 domain-containing protein [Saprospiraceae bacterium]HRF42356.1 DUF4159 domain-containing protein [Saprospiraceae bacterium]HRJ16387.1 DUF4159 domain-containing protein [Saprospiraceae bacterium]HRK82455.1 DUF4159 domain-containing protein [Saprospiraceae bacterium]